VKSALYRSRVATAAIVVALAGTVAAPARAASSPSPQLPPHLQRAAVACAAGEICLWRDRNHSGTPWRWSPGSGYRDLPGNLQNHVHSFRANVRGCFIDWTPPGRQQVNPGDYARAFDTGFGKQIDAIAPSC
jgi:hypothetical protein